MFFPAGRRVVPNVAAHAASRSVISRVAGPQFGHVANFGTAVTINFSPPPGFGDVVYVWQARQGGAPALATGGYTQIATGGTLAVMTVWRKIMGAIPDASVTSVVNAINNSLVMGALILRGVDGAIPEDVAATTQATTPPPITTVTANTWILSLYGALTEGIVNITAPPAGYSNFAAQAGNIATDTDYSLAIAGSTKLLTAAGTETPGNYTHNGLASIGHTVAARRG